MPIYDYRCANCGRRFQTFFRSFADVREATACPRCGASDVARLPSRVRLVRSEESRLDDIVDSSSLDDVDEDDPASVERWAERAGEEAGDEMSEDLGDDLDE